MSYTAGADLDRVDTTAKHALGSIHQAQNGKMYKYITYAAATAAVSGVAGEVCYYLAATGYAANDVTSDLSDSDEVGAGVLQAALADNEFGWIQIKGSATLTIALTAGADGNALTPTGAGDGTLDVVVTTVALSHICAYAGDASANEIMCDFLF